MTRSGRVHIELLLGLMEVSMKHFPKIEKCSNRPHFRRACGRQGKTKNSAQTFLIIDIIKPGQAIPAHSRILLIVGGSIKVVDEAFTLFTRPTSPSETTIHHPTISHSLFPHVAERWQWRPTTVCFVTPTTCYSHLGDCYIPPPLGQQTHTEQQQSFVWRRKVGAGDNGMPLFHNGEHSIYETLSHPQQASKKKKNNHIITTSCS